MIPSHFQVLHQMTRFSQWSCSFHLGCSLRFSLARLSWTRSSQCRLLCTCMKKSQAFQYVCKPLLINHNSFQLLQELHRWNLWLQLTPFRSRDHVKFFPACPYKSCWLQRLIHYNKHKLHLGSSLWFLELVNQVLLSFSSPKFA